MVIIQQRDITLNLVMTDGTSKSSEDMGILINYEKTTVCNSVTWLCTSHKHKKWGKQDQHFIKGRNQSVHPHSTSIFFQRSDKKQTSEKKNYFDGSLEKHTYVNLNLCF